MFIDVIIQQKKFNVSKVHTKLTYIKLLCTELQCIWSISFFETSFGGEITAANEDILSFPDSIIQFRDREHLKVVDESKFSVNMTTKGIHI